MFKSCPDVGMCVIWFFILFYHRNYKHLLTRRVLYLMLLYRFHLKPLKTWCNSLKTSKVQVPPTGRRFNSNKLEMTSGEQRIFNAICKNRSAIGSQRDACSLDETIVTSHHDAWTLEKSRPSKLKYSHNAPPQAVLPLTIQRMTHR